MLNPFLMPVVEEPVALSHSPSIWKEQKKMVWWISKWLQLVVQAFKFPLVEVLPLTRFNQIWNKMASEITTVGGLKLADVLPAWHQSLIQPTLRWTSEEKLSRVETVVVSASFHYQQHTLLTENHFNRTMTETYLSINLQPVFTVTSVHSQTVQEADARCDWLIMCALSDVLKVVQNATHDLQKTTQNALLCIKHLCHISLNSHLSFFVLTSLPPSTFYFVDKKKQANKVNTTKS